MTAPGRAAAVADPPTETMPAPAAAPEPALREARAPPSEVLPAEPEPEADEPPQAPEAEAPAATEPGLAAEASPSPEAPSPGDAAAQVVEAILADAVRRRASAIHLEPQPDGFALRLRIDGVLHPKPNFKQRLPKGIGRPLLARLKELANLAVSEGQGPQAGTFSGALEGRDMEFRLTTFPMLHGEKAVLKVVDREAALPTLDTLGFSPADLATVRQVLAERNARTEFARIVQYVTGVDPRKVKDGPERHRPGPVRCLALLYRGEDAIEKIRRWQGATNPEKAEAGTVRSDFGRDLMRNAAHASDSPENARHEREIIGMWETDPNPEFRQVVEEFLGRK
jgi:hypothetical protein